MITFDQALINTRVRLIRRVDSFGPYSESDNRAEFEGTIIYSTEGASYVSVKFPDRSWQCPFDSLELVVLEPIAPENIKIDYRKWWTNEKKV